ncbi:MAG: hypothetical protein ACFFAJ_04955 [Candidatus Hodarchaeota archaeon]
MSKSQIQPISHAELKRGILLGELWFMVAWITIIVILLIIPLEEFGELAIGRQLDVIFSRLFIYGTTFVFSIILLYLVGKSLDFNPYRGKYLAILGLILSFLGIFLFLQNNVLFLVLPGFWFIGLGSSLVGGVGIYFLAGFIPIHQRGVHISHSIGLGSLLILIISLIRLNVVSQETFKWFFFVGEIKDFLILFALFLVTFFVFCLTILISKNQQIGWTNDRWPTNLHDIIKRHPLKLSIISHFLVFSVFGLAISIIIDIVRIYPFNDIDIKWLPLSGVDYVDVFWSILFMGNFIAIWVIGYFVDRFGRKSFTIIGIYTISLALLGFSVSLTLISLIAAAIAIGIGVSGINLTLDTSMWMDLSPRDGLGRYTAFGLISLITGLSFGRLLSFVLIDQLGDITTSISILGFIMLFVTALAVYPLSLMDDTYPPLSFLLLLVRMEGGTLLYSNGFQKNLWKFKKLALISGGLEAIDSFMREVLERGTMEYVLHAGYYILNDQQGSIRANLITNKASHELRKLLKSFTKRFNDQYLEVIKDWNGDLSLFEDADEIVEEIFGPLISSSDLKTSISND